MGRLWLRRPHKTWENRGEIGQYVRYSEYGCGLVVTVANTCYRATDCGYCGSSCHCWGYRRSSYCQRCYPCQQESVRFSRFCARGRSKWFIAHEYVKANGRCYTINKYLNNKHIQANSIMLDDQGYSLFGQRNVDGSDIMAGYEGLQLHVYE